MKIIESAKEWDLAKYEKLTLQYLKIINDDIKRTKSIINMVNNYFEKENEPDLLYTKRQAAQLVGVTEETIRNWERNELIPQSLPYQKRFYSQATLNRMYLIRILLHTGYSIMIIRKFLMDYDCGESVNAIESLVDPGENDDLINTADRYLQSLLGLKEKATELHLLLNEMKKL